MWSPLYQHGCYSEQGEDRSRGLGIFRCFAAGRGNCGTIIVSSDYESKDSGGIVFFNYSIYIIFFIEKNVLLLYLRNFILWSEQKNSYILFHENYS